MDESAIDERGRSLAAPITFLVVVSFQLLSKFIENKKKRGPQSHVWTQLSTEIKQLYKEANSLSQPATFAQAAKLRRIAVAKEKDLSKIEEAHANAMKVSYDGYSKALNILKVFTFFFLICWFWRIPVAAISRPLVAPFGKLLSWRTQRSPLNDNIMVGIIPWLIISTRVGKLICRKVYH